jgi:solute carrier family 25 iron transporter 28/37
MTKFVGWENEEHQPFRVAACGGLSTLWHDCILTPHDVVKQRLQLGCHSGPMDCIMGIWRQEGLRGFYRSLPVTLAMNIPHMGLLVAANDSLKKAWRLDQPTSSATPLAKAPWYFACAGLSGAFAAAATLPFDVIKTKLQTQGSSATLPDATVAAARDVYGKRLATLPYNGIASTVASIAREKGLRGFYVGFGPRIVLCAPSAAICWGTYETVRLALQQLAGERERALSRGLGRDWHPSSEAEHGLQMSFNV